MDDHKMIAALSRSRHASKSASPDRAEGYYIRESEEYRRKYFKYAHNVYTVLGQNLADMPEGGIDREYLVRISPVIDITTGTKHGDDWKELSFYETFENIPLGMKFMFNKNVWIVFNTSNYSPVITTAIVRRCNSTLKRANEAGNIHAEPCVWDKDVPMQSKIIYRGSNNVFNPELNMYAQFNEFTKSIRTDDRFLFGVGESAQAFKIKEPVTFMLGETFNDDSSQLVMFSLERTLVSRALDDVENGVANRFAASIQSQLDAPTAADYIDFSPAVTQIDRFEKVTFTAKLRGGAAAEFLFNFSDIPANCFKVSNITADTFDLMCLVPYDKNPLKVIAVTQVGGEEFIKAAHVWLRSGL